MTTSARLSQLQQLACNKYVHQTESKFTMNPLHTSDHQLSTSLSSANVYLRALYGTATFNILLVRWWHRYNKNLSFYTTTLHGV